MATGKWCDVCKAPIVKPSKPKNVKVFIGNAFKPVLTGEVCSWACSVKLLQAKADEVESIPRQHSNGET